MSMTRCDGPLRMECPIPSEVQRVLWRSLPCQREIRRILSLWRALQRPLRFPLRLKLQFAFCCPYRMMFFNVLNFSSRQSGCTCANCTAIVPPSFGLPPGAISLPSGRGRQTDYLILSKASVATARISPTSQNLVTIFASGIGWLGHCILAGIPTF